MASIVYHPGGCSSGNGLVTLVSAGSAGTGTCFFNDGAFPNGNPSGGYEVRIWPHWSFQIIAIFVNLSYLHAWNRFKGCRPQCRSPSRKVHLMAPLVAKSSLLWNTKMDATTFQTFPTEFGGHFATLEKIVLVLLRSAHTRHQSWSRRRSLPSKRREAKV